MKKITLVFIFTLALYATCFAQTNQTWDDTFTITTYYPAPYGVYRNLRLHPSDEPTAGVAPGVMYFNQTDEKLYIYKNDTARWQPVGGGGGGTLICERVSSACPNPEVYCGVSCTIGNMTGGGMALPGGGTVEESYPNGNGWRGRANMPGIIYAVCCRSE